jgi:hypothetical protein
MATQLTKHDDISIRTYAVTTTIKIARFAAECPERIGAVDQKNVRQSVTDAVARGVQQQHSFYINDYLRRISVHLKEK